MKDIVEYDLMGEFAIASVSAREVIDSRGNPTVQVEVITEGGGIGIAFVPSGASVGKYEALELRNGDLRRFRGKGVSKAVKNVNEVLGPQIIGHDSRRQYDIDMLLLKVDGTPNKSRLGANAILGVSLAVAKAAADTLTVPLYFYLGGLVAKVMPTPMFNIINGGKHAGNELSIQEFMIVPGGVDSFTEALRMAVEVYFSLKEYLKDKYGAQALNVGDEGGFAPPMKRCREAIEALKNAIKRAGYRLGDDVAIALDAAASNFYHDGIYEIDGRALDNHDLLQYYVDLINEYCIISIEDPFHEDDFESFRELNKKVKDKCMIVGDDLFVTNIERLKKGISLDAASGAIVKMNQIGTLSETIMFVYEAKTSSIKTIISHRSGETEDPAIADIAVGLNIGIIKAGAPARGERTVKYNRLLRIEEHLGSEAKYYGFKQFR